MSRSTLAGLAACVLLAAAAGPAAAGDRQYYIGQTRNKWHYHPQQKAYALHYKYKVRPTDTTYKNHYAYHFPSRPKWVYFYNPVSKKYWGRCPVSGIGSYSGDQYTPPTYTGTYSGPSYQILDYGDRHHDLNSIREQSFHPLPCKCNHAPNQPPTDLTGPMPPVPDSFDGELMEPPPPPPGVAPA